jgi:hypothetical protein
MTSLARRLLPLAVAGFLVGCGGSGSSSGPPRPAPTVAAGCGSGGSSSETLLVAFSAGTTQGLPAPGYCSASLYVPVNNSVSGGLVQVTGSLAAPAGVATPGPGTGANGLGAGLQPATVFWYAFLPESGVTITSRTSPTLSVTISTFGTCSAFYAWLVAPGQAGSYIAGTLSSSTASFGGQTNATPVVFNSPGYAAITCM